MKTRIIKRNNKYYVQVKSKWWHLWGGASRWWGDYGPVYNKDGTYSCDMFRNFRYWKNPDKWHSNIDTLEEAQKVQQEVIAQGYLFKPTGVGFTDQDEINCPQPQSIW